MESSLDLDFEHYTVAWIAPLEIEAQAALYMLDSLHRGSFSTNRGDDYVYTAGDINGHNVIIATFPAGHDYGVGSAAALASQVKKSFPNLWFGLLVGVAAGLPDLSCEPPRDIRLGDVLVGVGESGRAGLVNYGLGKETPNGFEPLHHGELAKTEAIVSSAIGNIRNLTPIYGNDFLKYYDSIKDKEHTNGTFADPGQERDHLHQTVDENDLVIKLMERPLRPLSKRTKVWYGRIGSGDKLMKNAKKRDELRDKFNLIGLEMEAAGTMSTIPVGVIRGVCDYGDAQKNKEWQPYAAAMAAAYAKALLYKIRPIKNRRKEALQARKAFDTKKAKERKAKKKAEEKEAEMRAEEKKACLRSLCFSSIDDRQNNIAQAHQDTCSWLFETAQFQEWQHRNDLLSHNGVLWIKGKPGAGKSTLMKHTLLYCQETLRDHVIAAYFFNARGSMLEKTLLGMLRSLLYQLLKHYPLLFERFIPKFKDKQEMHGRKWEWQVGELKNFLLSEMKKSQPKPLLLLVDALDECNEPEVRELVSFLELLSINAVSAKTKLNICLSSRHYPRISMEKKLELVVEGQKEHEHDIFKYVQHNLRAGDERIEQELLRKANNIFMWVILVVKLLNEAFDEGDIRTMRKKLDEVPSGLNKMFSTIINKDNPDNRKRQNTILMFQWVLFAKQLLQPQELYFAVLAGAETEELGAWNRLNDTPEIIKRFITSTSKGLIEVRKGGIIETVQFIHESVNDFLLRKKRLQTLDPTLEQRAVEASHSRLMACCMSYIMIKELEPLPENISYLKEEPAISYPFLRYASTYTLHHAKNAQQTLVQRLHQLHNGFERFRSFHDAFQGSDLRYGTGAKLLYAVSLNGYYEFVQIVLEKGAEVNAQGGFYGNALQAASERGHEEVVALLLENGADVNAQGGHFGNALQAASEGGHEEVVALLVEKGSDVNAQGGYFGNALQAASASRHEAVMALLVEKGVDVNAEGGYFGNALQAASARGYEAAVLLLLENGADVNAEGGMFGNALQAASLGGHKAVVALLLENGAEVNAQGGWFGNALQAASAGGHEAVVLLLLENGADVNAQGGWFINALKAASDGRHKAVVTLLLEKGAQQH